MVDTVVITSEPNVAPAGHDQAMIDLVDKNAAIPTDDLADPQASSGAPEDRPQWLPEKFKSPEDMAKAYAELESKLGGNKPPADNATPDVPDNPQQALQDKGLDLNDFSQEFASKGELSQESYEKLAKAGYSKDIVDNYIAGQQARASQFESTIKTEVGGDERYGEMIEWAKANLTPGEISAYNAAVSSGNAEQAKLAALGLSAKFGKAVGSDPQRMLGGQKAGAEDVFESTAQLTEAMRDPRYRNDPAYRAKVQAKLNRSSIF
jgi:Phage T7 capsid assembly protein